MDQSVIKQGKVSKELIILNCVCALIYFSWWLIPSHVGNPILYGLLFFGETYHLLMAFTFWMTINPFPEQVFVRDHSFSPWIDIFITVAGEEIEIVRKTAVAARDLDYPNKRVYILNDGLVANKPNWREIEELAQEVGVNCITRAEGGGAKAGNINNALRLTKGEFLVIFDADMVPQRDFLQKTVFYFADRSIGFVQSPQFYRNSYLNEVTEGAWAQQEFFFGPIMRGKDNFNSAFICGTNVVIRRLALEEVGGMREDNIAEDFLTSLEIHQNGWRSKYVSEVLAKGLAPEDLLAYYKQQLRWARGSLEVLFGSNPLFKTGLEFKQKLQYLSSALYYFNGLIVLIDILMPLIFLFSGVKAVSGSTTSFALFFVPFMTLNLYTLYLSSKSSISFTAISFTQSAFVLQLLALKSVILRENVEFSVTPKQAQRGNFIFLSFPHLGYIVLALIASAIALHREGFNPSIVTNIAWVIFNIVLFVPFIRASLNSSFEKNFRLLPLHKLFNIQKL